MAVEKGSKKTTVTKTTEKLSPVGEEALKAETAKTTATKTATTKTTATTKATAAKTTAKAAAVTAEPKKEEKTTVKAEPKTTVKAAAKKTTKATTTAAKKTVTKKTTAKKAAETKATETKAVAKKEAEVATNLHVEWDDKRLDQETMVEYVKADWEYKGNKWSDVKELGLYIKPEENKIFYTINGEGSAEQFVHMSI